MTETVWTNGETVNAKNFGDTVTNDDLSGDESNDLPVLTDIRCGEAIVTSPVRYANKDTFNDIVTAFQENRCRTDRVVIYEEMIVNGEKTFMFLCDEAMGNDLLDLLAERNDLEDEEDDVVVEDVEENNNE